MRPLFIVFFAAAAFAQDTAPPKQDTAPPKEAAPAAPAAAAPAAAEPAVSGSVEIGYRWNANTSGNYNAYRSVVNLGEGPRLLGLDLQLTDPNHRLFDSANIMATGWGGDPAEVLHVNARKGNVYSFTADYRSVAYFSALPSFANPNIDRGVLTSQQSFDMRQRMADIELDFRPGSRIVPYLAYSHDSGFGQGVTGFVSDANNYAVPTNLREKTDNFRGGVRFEMNRWHVTLEQGGTIFKDDQRVYDAQPTSGDIGIPFLGQNLFLGTLQQAYGIRGSSIYTKALVTANVTSWMDVYGQFLFSQPKTDVNYFQTSTGLNASLAPLLFYNAQTNLFAAATTQPHTTGSAGAEIRPLARVRVIESWMTDRLHSSDLVMNYSQAQIEALVDITKKLTLRGGYRYVWGDSLDRTPQLAPIQGLETGQLRRNVGLAGLVFHATQRLSFSMDAEIASGDHSYFVTSLRDYQKLRARAAYQLLTSLRVTANFSYLNNDNPAAVGGYSFQNRTEGLGIVWTPSKSNRLRVTGEYTRSALSSDLLYVVPQDYSRARSFYRDNAHMANGMVDFTLPKMGEIAPRISLGGSMFLSSGSRPTSFYQPVAKLVVPVHKHFEWLMEYRWYGMAETFYAYEGFRSNQLTFGARIY